MADDVICTCAFEWHKDRAGKKFRIGFGMRILMVDCLAFTPPYNAALAEALVAQGHDVRMAGMALPDDQQWPATSGVYRSLPLSESWVKLAKHGVYGRAIGYARTLFALRREVTIWHPDVVHFQWSFFPLLELVLLITLRLPVALTMHDSVLANGDRVASSRRIGLRHLVRRADILFSHTEQGAAVLRQYARKDAVLRQIHHAPIRYPYTGPRQVNPAPDERLNVLLFGMIKHYKGLDLLIEAAANLTPTARLNVRFRVVGRMEIDGEALIALAKERGVYELFDFDWRFVPEMEIDDIMRSADVFIFPYRAIDASGVFVTALPYRKPVIASKIGLFADILAGSELLVPPGDVKALTKVLDHILTNKEFLQRMTTYATDIAIAMPSWEQTACDTLEAYRDGGVRG